jgi:hypothetical protein
MKQQCMSIKALKYDTVLKIYADIQSLQLYNI